MIVGDTVVMAVVVVGLETVRVGDDIVMMMVDWVPEIEVMY